ncbi:hypothetical protein QEZ48_10765 [Aquamicrobium lusatiense]|uniref:hypothetical protein n=1 Tax=Aquamicrobium lusatiense TaxID=89772 RepID=UPI002455B6D2|nr:hypothetical protein [Aquamicrobium lusatiense]MDH4991304.1 hypothetical protein [Aquamicrobium lusatiense]
MDKLYSLSLASGDSGYGDETFALFWASMEILKPAIYAKPPKPVATPRFADGGKTEKVTAELIQRCLESTFDRDGIDEVMLELRDDLAITNRGAPWVTYETDEKSGGQRVCIEHLDRTDFLHEPARKWSEVGWVARRAWMTFTQMKKRFKDVPEDKLRAACYDDRSKDIASNGMVDSSAKAGVWEVWHRNDNKVYWVTPSVDVILDEGEPHLDLHGFFPCPRPAYGTLQRRTLIPIPDYKRYSYHLEQINDLTARIYTLLDKVKLRIFIPAGGDIGEAVEKALASEDADSVIMPVPAAALSATAGNNLFVTLPLTDIAQTITGLIEARGQLIQDFYQLSGISDIMRGATEAQETLGAQQLKSQYGSVRVRDKIDELQRVARDLAFIASQIMAKNFSSETLLELGRMTIPTKREIESKIKEAEKAAKDALEELAEDIKKAAEENQEPVDPAQVKAQFQQQQQQIMAQYQPVIDQLSATVPIEDVMDMLRDTRGMNLVIDIETDSTILTDEIAEKQSRAEFLQAFSTATQSVAMLMQAGEPGANLAGGILKFALQPYKANRQLDDLIDEFVEKAPQALAQQGDGGNETEKAIAEANQKIAEAELGKAQAAIKKVEADAGLKTFELQQKQQQAAVSAEQDRERFQLEIADTQGKLRETDARIEKIGADIELAFAKLGIEAHREEREDLKTAADIQMRSTDQAMQAQNAERDAAFRAQDSQRSDRSQDFTERSSDRQITLAERQAMQERKPNGTD